MFLLHYVAGLGRPLPGHAAGPTRGVPRLVGRPAPAQRDRPGYSADPRYIDEIEWFASPADVCRTFAGLQALVERSPRCLPCPTILSHEVGGIGLDPSGVADRLVQGRLGARRPHARLARDEPATARPSSSRRWCRIPMPPWPRTRSRTSWPSAEDAFGLLGLGWPVSHDVVLAGGRVVDPETGSTGCATWASTATRSLRSATASTARRPSTSAGSSSRPGFIDLHSHAQTLPGRRLQACDGVTTALDLEAGRSPVELAYAREARRGSPINYGFSASWAAHADARDGGRTARRGRCGGLRRDGRHRVAAGGERRAGGADPRPDLDRPRRGCHRDRSARRLRTGRRSGRVRRRRGAGGGRRGADVHALA